MKAKMHPLFFVVLLIMLATLVVACGGDEEEPVAEDEAAVVEEGEVAEEEVVEETEGEEAVEGEVAVGELPAECEAVTLEYWNPFTGPDGPFMGEIVDAFSTEHPQIDVIMTTQSEYYTQLSTAAASETLPDVAVIHADQIATWAFRNVLRPIDDLVAGMEVEGGNFPEEVWNIGEVGGRRFAIPLDIHPMTLFYNADLLQEAGVDPTELEDGVTAEEFEAAAAAVSEAGNNGFMLTTGFPNRQIFEMLLHQAGGRAFSEEGAEVTWDSAEGVQALEWMREAQVEWGEPNLEVDAELNAFKGGTVGMIWNGIWQTANVTGEAVPFDGRATAVPQIFDEAAVWGGSHQLTLPAQSEEDPCRDAAAGIFIDYLLDNSVTWAAAGQIPASNEVRESPAFQEIEPQADIAPSAQYVFFPPAVPGITDAYAPLDEAVAAVLAGEATDIEAALAESAQRAEQILAENRESYGEELEVAE
ncbi:MAG: ABC transporter substrate-binding protein [Chloroflexota bacterium]|nr:ABC transporter substrate-binding protein [Chloroflexota bacterium]